MILSPLVTTALIPRVGTAPTTNVHRVPVHVLMRKGLAPIASASQCSMDKPKLLGVALRSFNGAPHEEDRKPGRSTHRGARRLARSLLRTSTT